jgi:plasmid maintenance system antidote protein VapI
MENFASSEADDFRAAIARYQLKIYRLAPRAGLHPSNLSSVLHGRRPLTDDRRRRLGEAIIAERAALGARS